MQHLSDEKCMFYYRTKILLFSNTLKLDECLESFSVLFSYLHISF